MMRVTLTAAGQAFAGGVRAIRTARLLYPHPVPSLRGWGSGFAAILTFSVIAFAAPLRAEEPPAPPADLVEQLMQKEDPANDDWVTEVYYKKANKQLGKLGAELAKNAGVEGFDVDEFFEADARVVADFEQPIARYWQAGDYDVVGLRFRPVPLGEPGEVPVESDTPVEGLKFLMKNLAGEADVRVAFKIIGVLPLGEGTFVTDVLAQASGSSPKQANVRWHVVWSESRADDGTEHLRIRRIGVRDFTWVESKRAFSDATRRVIRDDATWHPYLSRGADHWYGRVDAVGEINFLGHEGIAVGDANGDGLDDVYVALGTGVPNRLLIQQPDGTVKDTAAAAGVDWLDSTKGVLFVDLDNDGDQDLLTAIGPTIVYQRNDGTGKFEAYRALKATTPAAFYSLAAADYDLDGDLDIYGVRYVKVRYGLTSAPIPLHDANNGPRNHLLRNDGDAGFVDVTADIGLDVNNTRFSTAAAWCDYDDDGDSDLYVTNDFGRKNLYRNDGGRFADVAAEAGVEDQGAGMGASWGDYDGDGDFDLYTSNMFSSAGQRVAYQPRFMKDQPESVREGVRRHSLGNSLLVNDGKGKFEDKSDEAGVRMGRWAWGAKFVDFNNDGREDIFVPNGFLTNEKKDDL